MFETLLIISIPEFLSYFSSNERIPLTYRSEFIDEDLASGAKDCFEFSSLQSYTKHKH